MRQHAPFTPFEIRMIEQWYPHIPTQIIAKVLQRDADRIRRFASKNGVHKTAAYAERFGKSGPGAPVENSGRFSRGIVPWNKGTKGLQLGGEATQFKPGQKPKNYLPVGSHRFSKEGYLQKKLTDTGYPPRDWVCVHHLVWRMHGRVIPRGFRLCFIDGDKTNIDINNLELVSIADVMRRNTRHNLPAEINQVIHLRAVLNRRINRITKEQTNG